MWLLLNEPLWAFPFLFVKPRCSSECGTFHLHIHFLKKIVIVFVISIAEMLPVSPLLALLPWSVAVKPAYSFISELPGF